MNGKIWIKTGTAAGAFLLLFLSFQIVLQPHWTASSAIDYGVESAYTELTSLAPGTIEVLFAGTSHVYCGIDPMVLYEQTGITSYNISGPGMQLDTCYLALQHCLKSQQPKVLVLDMSAIHYEAGDEAKSHKILDQLPLSVSKILYAIRNRDKDLHFLEVLFPLFRYHSRWTKLKAEDLKKVFSKQPKTVTRGHSISYHQELMEFLFSEGGDFKINDYNKEYLDRIVRLCHQKDISLVLIKIPAKDWTAGQSDWVAAYAQEHKLMFIELYHEIDAMLLDRFHDFRDDHDHLNQYGAQKVTMFLGSILKKNFLLTDQRGENGRWDEDLITYRKEKQKTSKYS